MWCESRDILTYVPANKSPHYFVRVSREAKVESLTGKGEGYGKTILFFLWGYPEQVRTTGSNLHFCQNIDYPYKSILSTLSGVFFSEKHSAHNLRKNAI